MEKRFAVSCKKHLKCGICSEQHITELHPSSTTACIAMQEEDARITPTAIVEAEGNDGITQKVRSIIERISGAESSFITTDTAKTLGLKLEKINSIVIKGINNSHQTK